MKKFSVGPVRRMVTVAAAACISLAGVSMTASGDASAAASSSCGVWMDRSLSPGERAGALVRAMDLDQKISMVHQALGFGPGSYGAAGFVPAIPSLCVPALVLNDAGNGLGDAQVGVTDYPAGIAQAASWDPAMARTVGRSLGGEAFAKGVNVLLAPDVNIARTPLNGRTSEAFGEDPFLSASIGVGFIRGVQSQHVIATVKHYDANNQEVDRGSVSADVSRRALEEIYQPAFAAAVRQGHVGAVMCAYNRVNSVYACQNGPLLRRDLVQEMGFDGFVMSDWGATHSTVASARNGLDMEMDIAQQPDGATGAGPVGAGGVNLVENYYGAPLKQAVQTGKVPRWVLNSMVRRITGAMFAVGLFDHPAPSVPSGYVGNVDTPANRAVALHGAEAGSVLLKNERGTLPLTGHGLKIAVIGAGASAAAPTYVQAGGSVRVNQPDVVTPLQAIIARGAQEGDTVTYDDGSSPQAAAALAKASDVAIVFGGYVQTEGSDRTDLGYDQGVCQLKCFSQPSNTNQLVDAVAAANPRTAVVLNTGGPAEMPWLGKVGSALEMWYPGEEDGDAAASLLFGDVNPSGKLPITFPRSLSQLPTQTAAQYPGVNGHARYTEGLLVGYRWYDARQLTPLFPFGFGLSYTRFRLSDLRLTRHGSTIEVTLTLTNTGTRAGAQVVQAYVGDPPRTGEPPRQLKAFRKISLPVGQHAQVRLTLSPSAFAHWDTTSSRWVTTPGRYLISIGDSSAHLPLQAAVRLGRR